MTNVDIRTTTLSPTPALAIRASVPMAELPSFFAGAYQELYRAIAASGGAPVGSPCARYFSAPPGPIDVEAIVPLAAVIAESGRAHIVELAGGAAIETTHVGAYDAMAPAYSAIAEYLSAHNLEAADAPREVYVAAPGAPQQRTLLVQPVRSVARERAPQAQRAQRPQGAAHATATDRARSRR